VVTSRSVRSRWVLEVGRVNVINACMWMIVVLGRTYIVRKVVIKPGGVMEKYNVREYVDVGRQQHAAKSTQYP